MNINDDALLHEEFYEMYRRLIAQAFTIPASVFTSDYPDEAIENLWRSQRHVEWAKQLAFFAFGPDLDFSTMEVHVVSSDIRVYKVTRVRPAEEVYFSGALPMTLQEDVYTVLLSLYHDPYGNEVVPLGYSQSTNKLLIGPGRCIEELPWLR